MYKRQHFPDIIIDIYTADREGQSSSNLADRLRLNYEGEFPIGPTRPENTQHISEHTPTLLDRPRRTIKLTEKAR